MSNVTLVDADGVPVGTALNQLVVSGGGGGGGGAVTVANGADVTQGAITDAAVTNPASSATVVALLKGLITKIAGAQGTVAAGVAATNAQLGAAVYNSSSIMLTDTQQAALQSDQNGFLKVNVAAGSGSNSAAGSVGAAVGAAASYTGLNVSGTLRGQTAVNPTGTVYAASTDLTSVNGVTTLTGTGATGTGAQRVTVAVDSATVAGSASLPAGTNVIGHVISDSGSTTAVTQATAASLNATVVGTGTFVVQPSDASAGAAAATSATVGSLSQGLVTTAAPTYTTAQRNPLSLNTAGGLRVDGSGVTQPVSQASAASLNATVVGTGTFVVQNSAATPAGSSIIGKVGIDQTTPGTTNGVQVNAALPAGSNVIGHVIMDSGSTTVVTGTVGTNIAQVNGATVNVGTGSGSTGTQRVTTSTDSTIGTVTAVTAITNALPAGTNLMGKVGIDQTTPGTTNGVQLTAALPTGSNIIGNIRIDQTSPGTTNGVVVNAAIPAGSNVIGHVIVDATSTTAVTQATAANLNATVVGTGTLAVQNTAATPAGSNIIGNVRIDQTTPGTTNNVTTVGPTASGASLTVNPVTHGGLAKTANPTAVADGQVVNTLHDKLGKIIAVSAVRNLKGSQRTVITSSTAETTIVTAVASTFLDLYGLVLQNSSASATTVDIRDTTAGTVITSIVVPAGDTRGFMLDAGSAIAQTTVNTNWTAQCGTSVASLTVTALYVRNL